MNVHFRHKMLCVSQTTLYYDDTDLTSNPQLGNYHGFSKVLTGF